MQQQISFLAERMTDYEAQIAAFERMCGEYLSIAEKLREEFSVKAQIVRQEIADSEDRMKILYEEARASHMPDPESNPKDILQDEQVRPGGYQRWTARKAEAAAKASDIEAFKKRVGYGDLSRTRGPEQINVRGGNDRPGASKAPTEGTETSRG